MAADASSANFADQTAQSASLGSRLGQILFLTAIFFFNFLARILLAPLSPSIEKDLSIGHGEAGSLFLLISLGYFVALLGSGFLSARISHHRTIVLSAISAGLLLLAASFSGGLSILRLSMFVLGMATGIYIPSGIATLTAAIDSRHWGKAISIHELAPNLGFVLAPLIAEALLLQFSWRGGMRLLGGAMVVTGLFYGRYGRGGEFPGQAPGFESLKSLFGHRSFWIMIALFSLGISGTLGLFTMLPLYLVTEHGMARSDANALVAFSRVSTLVVVFAAGWAVDRFGPRRTISWVMGLSGGLTLLLGILSGTSLAAAIFVQAMVAACYFPAGFAALSFSVPVEARNIAVSFTAPMAFFVGGGATPTAIGLMGDAGLFGPGISLVGGAILAGAVLPFFLRFSDRSLPSGR